jgi:acetoin utilization deacetylase AcuC-like enzyme
LKVVYSARYGIDIGPHVFPTQKYALVHARLVEAGIVLPGEVIEPLPAGWDELAAVHTRDYLARIRSGAMSPEDVAQLELPWSSAMVEGFRLMVGGTMLAARIACGNQTDGSGRRSDVVCHLGGGLHHAFPGHGEGFCPFNDVAVAIRGLLAGGLERAAVVDLDVHHGNGTAFIFEADPRVFTFSMHQQHNYPMWKPAGSLDIGLPDGAGDLPFLTQLRAALPRVLASGPQCVFYLAGADPYEDDQLGGLRLTKEGLRERDRLVLEAVVSARVPLVITLAGGYARHIEDTVGIHVATVQEAARAASAGGRPLV